MSDSSWYLKAQKQYDEWAKEMVGVAATGEFMPTQSGKKSSKLYEVLK